MCIKLVGDWVDKTASRKLICDKKCTQLVSFNPVVPARVSSNADWQALHTFELKLIKSWDLPKSCVKVASKSSLAGMLIIFPNIVYQVKKAFIIVDFVFHKSVSRKITGNKRYCECTNWLASNTALALFTTYTVSVDMNWITYANKSKIGNLYKATISLSVSSHEDNFT